MGKLTGAKILNHNEPIIGMYTPEGELILPKFTAQYKEFRYKSTNQGKFTKN